MANIMNVQSVEVKVKDLVSEREKLRSQSPNPAKGILVEGWVRENLRYFAVVRIISNDVEPCHELTIMFYKEASSLPPFAEE